MSLVKTKMKSLHLSGPVGRLARTGSLIFLSVLFVGCQSGPFSRSSSDGTSRGLLGLKKKQDNALKADDILDPLGERNYNRILPQDLAPSQLGTTLKTRWSKTNQPEKATDAFNEGQGLYAQALVIKEANPDGDEHLKDFEAAAKQFRIASSSWKDSALEQDALFYEGESLFFANRYVQSNRAFEKLISLYSGTRYLDKAEARRFAIAQYWLGVARDQKTAMVRIPYPKPAHPAWNLASEARRILNRIRIDDPSGKLADDATMALANAFMEAEMYQEAADTYEDLRRTYPGTPHLFQAHLFELKSRMSSYYGESYDQEPLIKSDQLLRQIVRQFPAEAKKEEAYLAQEATAIRTMLAQRDYSLGEYYAKRGENRAATIMFEQVAQKYGDTELGMQVNEQIAGLSDKPALPPQRAQWLVDLMPKSEASKPMIATGNQESIFR